MVPPLLSGNRLLRRLAGASPEDQGEPSLPTAWTIAADELHASAVKPLLALLALAVALGAAVIPACDAVMRPNAIAAHIHSVIAYAIPRELMPLLVTVILALRSGTALAVAMSSDDDARRPARDSILPRAAGLALAGAGLTVWMSAAALIGGYLVAALAGLLPTGLLLPDILAAIDPAAAYVALAKSALAGAVIGILAGCFGIRARTARPMQPRSASNRAQQAAARAALGGLLGGLAVNAAVSFIPLLAPGS